MKKQMKRVQVTIQLSEHIQSGQTSYESLFLRTKIMDKCGCKIIYLRPEYHQRLSRIAQVIGEDKIPLYAYFDNILSHHFDLFENMLIAEFEAKCKPLF
ncbi:DUF3408 domain-containing protein [Sphingobacterium sp. SRCM116780]|uniref:DUF3408 domain-containing protein n=1 Tax=Sphingobacterium sp. SRCM116780 TaxID=2907623 RepID=UPI001F480915|nr:DUF3408 domain-containing protein [Sphingobacterium sp. SRCM116780]UIR57847.1 DUF3408 domain-containing protein [Sphingobacterium sp. SRCM116780]